MKYNYGIKNISDYGYETIEKIYRMCHEEQNFPIEYIDQFRHNGKTKLYEKIRLNCNHQDIIDMIDGETIIDDIMYDYAVINKNKDLILYFETKYNMKPNVTTLARI